jgi:hypothetical protein
VRRKRCLQGWKAQAALQAWQLCSISGSRSSKKLRSSSDNVSNTNQIRCRRSHSYSNYIFRYKQISQLQQQQQQQKQREMQQPQQQQQEQKKQSYCEEGGWGYNAGMITSPSPCLANARSRECEKRMSARVEGTDVLQARQLCSISSSRSNKNLRSSSNNVSNTNQIRCRRSHSYSNYIFRY